MTPTLRRLLCLAASGLTLGLPHGHASDASASTEIKRITDRYALTRKRIDTLLGPRLHPVALPANPPNPFYQPLREPLADPAAPAHDADTGHVPEAADISDIDSLRKIAPALRLGGVINRGGTLFVIINNTPCKIGDIITVGSKDRPVYLKLADLSTTGFTLGLNDATLEVPLRK